MSLLELDQPFEGERFAVVDALYQVVPTDRHGLLDIIEPFLLGDRANDEPCTAPYPDFTLEDYHTIRESLQTSAEKGLISQGVANKTAWRIGLTALFPEVDPYPMLPFAGSSESVQQLELGKAA